MADKSYTVHWNYTATEDAKKYPRSCTLTFEKDCDAQRLYDFLKYECSGKIPGLDVSLSKYEVLCRCKPSS